MVSDWLLLISCCLLLVSPLVGCWMVVGGRWLIGWFLLFVACFSFGWLLDGGWWSLVDWLVLVDGRWLFNSLCWPIGRSSLMLGGHLLVVGWW